jgi:hypothetical protein
MRFGVLCIFVGACGFEVKVKGNADQFQEPDASTPKPPDASTPTPMPDGPPAKVCAPAYQSVPATQTQSKYRRVQVQTEWLTAKADCESDGGHIVVPETATEAIAIHAFVDPLDTSPYFWAGILDPEQDAQWVTVDGKPFTIPAWGSGDPDQREGEIYAIVFSNGNYYDWFDYGTQEYACECEP